MLHHWIQWASLNLSNNQSHRRCSLDFLFFSSFFKCRGINLTFSYCNSESSTWTAHVWGPPAIFLLIDFLQVEQMHKWSFKEQIQTSCLRWPLFVLDPTVSEETTLLSLLGCFFYPHHIRCSFLPDWCLFSLKRRLVGVSGGRTLNPQLSLTSGLFWAEELKGKVKPPVVIMETKESMNPESTSGLLLQCESNRDDDGHIPTFSDLTWTHLVTWTGLKPQSDSKPPAALLWSETFL